MDFKTLVKKYRIIFFALMLTCVLISLGIWYRFFYTIPPSCDFDINICDRESMEYYSSRGSGTNDDPYIIENQFFIEDFRIDVCCAEFAFTLQSCTFLDSNLFLFNLAIFLFSIFLFSYLCF